MIRFLYLTVLKNMPAMGSNPERTVPSYVGLTILLWVMNKSMKGKPSTRNNQ